MTDIQNNLQEVLKGISSEVCLVAVSKTKPISDLQEAYEVGQRVFGENKVQELTDKYEALPKDIQWHMIGHLQSNKVKYIAPFVALIHSVDSFKLLKEINKQGEKVNRVIDCLLQVHIAEEDTKYGFDFQEVKEIISSNELTQLNFINIKGLMGMATFTDNTQKIKREFDSLHTTFKQLKEKTLPDNVSMETLSMGMSGDYQLAITSGSNMIRVGNNIFGARNYNN